MCLQQSRVLPYQKWRWGGDDIVPSPIIPAARTVPGTRRRRYPIDARSFLGIEDNAVVRAHLEEIVASLEPEERQRFQTRGAGAFDLRTARVTEHVGRLKYIRRGRGYEEWLFPEETLAEGGGDCEDLAFCLAALLEASGISPYCVRVALGSIVHHVPGAAPRSWDHAWVVYLNEGGAWQILEPLAIAGAHAERGSHGSRDSGASEGTPAFGAVEYIPHFVLNRHHLWRVRSGERRSTRPLPDYLSDRTFWDGFDPSFGSASHSSVLDEALAGMPPRDLARVKDLSLIVDADTTSYDPRDHFDFGYIEQSWQRIRMRLGTGRLKDFAYAAHAIGDFYAHTNYAEYGLRRPSPRPGQGSLVPYDPDHPEHLRAKPEYDFTKYAPLPGCREPPARAAAHWRGRIISGQWWRWFASYPEDLQTPAELALRRALPDHDLVAVDGPRRPAAHRAYDEAEYQIQFADRRAAAVEHIRKVYLAWRR